MNPNQAPNPNVKLIAGVGLATVSLLLYAYLKVKQIETAEFIIFVGPLVTYLLIGGKVEHETNKQNEVLKKIDEQTNGVLENKIRKITTEVVTKVLDDRDKQGKLF